jgi:hypothetical protein
VADILASGRELASLHAAESGRERPSAAQREIALQIRGFMDELEALGCSYKDWSFSIGLIDFPAIIDGKEMLLCWRSDEPDISHYHGVDEGYAGRKALSGSPAPAQRS